MLDIPSCSAFGKLYERKNTQIVVNQLVEYKRKGKETTQLVKACLNEV